MINTITEIKKKFSEWNGLNRRMVKTEERMSELEDQQKLFNIHDREGKNRQTNKNSTLEICGIISEGTTFVHWSPRRGRVRDWHRKKYSKK